MHIAQDEKGLVPRILLEKFTEMLVCSEIWLESYEYNGQ